MVYFTTAQTERDLNGILSLQKKNLATALSPGEIKDQGFVTVDHSYSQLKKLNDLEQHIIAKDGDQVIGYLLAMTKESRNDIPVLKPMFNEFDNMIYQNKKVASSNYLVVGQVCIDKVYRGKGILDECYLYYREHFSSFYDFAITEIANTNQRSLKAHLRIGFEVVHTYPAPGNEIWQVVLWNWKKN